jgi:hypothetical protein
VDLARVGVGVGAELADVWAYSFERCGGLRVDLLLTSVRAATLA